MTAPVEQLQLVPIPGPDPGSCPTCGEWIKAGIPHTCADSQLEMLPEWDGALPVPYNIIPFR